MRPAFAIAKRLLEDGGPPADPEAPLTPPEEEEDDYFEPKALIARIDEPTVWQGPPTQGSWIRLVSKARSGRNGRSRKLENNTYAELIDHYGNENPKVAVRLHATNVIVIESDDTVIVGTGGWSTVTTKDRINRYLPGAWNLYSLKGDWYWGGIFNMPEGTRQPFTNGDRILADGTLYPQAAPEYSTKGVRGKRLRPPPVAPVE